MDPALHKLKLREESEKQTATTEAIEKRLDAIEAKLGQVVSVLEKVLDRLDADNPPTPTQPATSSKKSGSGS